ncbi:glycine oxidase ThiO [Metabacillus sp. HB246100]
MKTNYDVAIVGGGIIGQSIAYHLAKENVSVVVLEGNAVGYGATRAAAGMLGANSELDDDDAFYQFAKESQRYYHTLNQELFDLSQVSIQLFDRGMYKLAYNEEEAKMLKRALPMNSTLEWHPREQVLKHEPTLSSDLVGALYIPEDGHVSPFDTCLAFSKSARFLGADIVDNVPVHSIEKTDEKDYALQTAKGTYYSKHVVIANGVWSHYFLQNLDLQLGMKPVKGECLSVKSDKIKLEKTIFYDHCYIVPKGNGKLVIGATMVEDDWTTEPTFGGIQSLMNKMAPILPDIKYATLLDTWAGLRPQTIDGKPYIGQHPSGEHLYFATGHYRNGILLAPKTGEMMANLIVGKQVKKEYVEAFSLTRDIQQVMR